MPAPESITLDAIIHDPGFFLDGIDAAAGTLRFLRTDRAHLAAAAFLDGRTPFALDGTVYTLPAREVLERAPDPDAAAASPGFIFHTGFCGSTLLARSLDLPGRAFTYREPQVLVQLADLKKTRHPWCTDPAHRRALVGFVLGQLSKTWSAGERAIIKPSNWVNNLTAELLEVRPASPALCLSIDLRAYLVAIVRGGTDRIRFCCKLFEHLQSAIPMFVPLGASATLGAADGMVPVMRLCALTWFLQRQLLQRAPGQSTKSVALDYATMIADPVSSLNAAAGLFGIEFAETEPDRIVAGIWSAHAKNAGERFDAAEFEAIGARVEREYGRYLDGAIDWCRERLGDA